MENTVIVDVFANAFKKFVNAPLSRVVTLHVSDPKNDNVAQTLSRIVENESFTGLFRGALAPSIAYVPALLASKFVVPQVRRITPHLPRNIFAYLAVGFVAPSVVMVFSYPFDFCKIALQADMGPKYRNEGIVDCFKKMYTKNGLGALYTGYGLSFLEMISYRVLFFVLYDNLIDYMPRNDAFKMGIFRKSISLVSSIALWPLTVIRTRLIVDKASGRDEYSGAIDCAKKIVRKEGYKSLFSGVFIQLVGSEVLTYTKNFTSQLLLRAW